MEHVTGVSAIIQQTFFTNTLSKLIASFFSILIGLIVNQNGFIIGSILIVYLINFIIGVIRAISDKEFESKKFFKGCNKLLVYSVFMVIGATAGEVLHLGNALLSFIFGFIFIQDSISTLENLEKMGFSTPTGLTRYLKVYKDKLDFNKDRDEK